MIEESAAGTICSAKGEDWTEDCKTCIGKRKNWSPSNCIWCTNGDKRADTGGNCVGEAKSCKDDGNNKNKFIINGQICPTKPTASIGYFLDALNLWLPLEQGLVPQPV